MKEPHSELTRRYSERTGDIKKDLTPQQLAGIGAAALAYNEAERRVDDLFQVATGLDDKLALEVSTRLSVIDGKIGDVPFDVEIGGQALPTLSL